MDQDDNLRKTVGSHGRRKRPGRKREQETERKTRVACARCTADAAVFPHGYDVSDSTKSKIDFLSWMLNSCLDSELVMDCLI